MILGVALGVAGTLMVLKVRFTLSNVWNDWNIVLFRCACWHAGSSHAVAKCMLHCSQKRNFGDASNCRQPTHMYRLCTEDEKFMDLGHWHVHVHIWLLYPEVSTASMQ